MQKGKFILRSVLSEGRYFREDHYVRDLLTPGKGSLLLKLYVSGVVACKKLAASGKAATWLQLFMW